MHKNPRDILAPILTLLRSATAGGLVLTGLVLAIIAISAAPGSSPGFGRQFALMLVAIVAALGLTALLGAPTISDKRVALQVRLLGDGLLIVALLLNLWQGITSTIWLAVGMAVIWMAMRWVPLFSKIPATAAAIIVAVPFWVWTALDRPISALWWLIPVSILGLHARGHLVQRTATESADDPTNDHDSGTLSARAHRYAAWLSIALAGVIIMLAGLWLGLSLSWVSLAGAALAVAIPLEAGGQTDRGSRASLVLVDAVFVLVAICWMIAVP